MKPHRFAYSRTCMAALEGCGPALARIAPSEVLVAQWPDERIRRVVVEGD